MDELKHLWNEEMPDPKESEITAIIAHRSRHTVRRFIGQHSRMLKIIAIGISGSLVIFLLASDWLSEPGTAVGFIKLLSIQVMLAVFFLGMNANIRTIDAGDNLRKRLGIMITKVKAIMWGEIVFLMIFYPLMAIVGNWISGNSVFGILELQTGWVIAGTGLQLLMVMVLYLRYSGYIKELELERDIYFKLKKDQP